MDERHRRPRAKYRVMLAFAGSLLVIAAVVLMVRGSPHSQLATSSSGPPPSIPALAGASPPAQPPPTAEQFGANVNGLFLTRGHTPGQIAAQLQALRETGARVARADALWEATEPRAPVNGVHRYVWGFDDLIAASLASHGLRWLPILDYSAPWAQSPPGHLHSPPGPDADYAAYAAAFANRYGQGGTFWSAHPQLIPEPVDTYEIWNEPDNAEFWYPVPDPARYTHLYLSARDAITSVQAAARVIVGGLSDPTRFLPSMLHATPQLAGQLDGVAIHPYGANPDVVLARVRAARRTLRLLGLPTVPLYVTEFGWRTRPAGAVAYAPARLRPSYIGATLARLARSGCGVATVVLYTWVAAELDPANPQYQYAIHPRGGGSSPDTAAFTKGIRRANRAASATGCD